MMMNKWFSKFALWVSRVCGKPHTFILALVSMFVWGLFGPYTNYSDDWMLWVNTGTTIITFLLVFVLQNSQTRESTAMQIKLDELIRVTQDARNRLIDVENASDAELVAVKKTLSDMREP